MEEALRRVGKQGGAGAAARHRQAQSHRQRVLPPRARATPSLDLTIFTALSACASPPARSDLEKALHRAAGRAHLRQLSRARLPARRCAPARLPPNVRVIEFFFEPGSLLDVGARAVALPVGQLHARGARAAASGRERDRARGRQAHGRRHHRDQPRQQSRTSPSTCCRTSRSCARPGTPVVMLGQVHREMPFMLGAANVGADDLRPAARPLALRLRPVRAAESVAVAPWITPSACTRARWCATAARCRSASASSAMRSSTRCCCAISRTTPGGARCADAGTERSAALDRFRAAAARRSPPACSAPPRCSSTRCSTCTAPASCAGASTTIYRCNARWRRTARARASTRRCSRPCWPRARARCSTPRDVAALQGRRRPAQRDALRQGQHRLARRRAHRGGPRRRRRRARRSRASAWASSCRAARSCTPGSCSGPRAFYAALRALPESERRLFDMRGVGYINQLYGDDQQLRVAQRSHARFVNTTMMLTTLGAAVSDGLADGRVVSGVGGQYNFVAMAHALPGARSVLCVRVDAPQGRQAQLQHRHRATATPRFRAICATSRSPNTASPTCAAAPTANASPRCSTSPTRASRRRCSRDAKRANKIDAGYRIPEQYRHNTPERLEAGLRRAAPRRTVLRVSVRHGSHARGNRSGARVALAQGKHRRRRARLRDDRARAVHAWPRDQRTARYLERLRLGAPADFAATADREAGEPRAARHARDDAGLTTSRTAATGSLNALNSSALPEGS